MPSGELFVLPPPIDGLRHVQGWFAAHALALSAWWSPGTEVAGPWRLDRQGLGAFPRALFRTDHDADGRWTTGYRLPAYSVAQVEGGWLNPGCQNLPGGQRALPTGSTRRRWGC